MPAYQQPKADWTDGEQEQERVRAGPRSRDLHDCEMRGANERDGEQLDNRPDQEAPRAREPQDVWARLQRRDARLLDVHTGIERSRYGAPPRRDSRVACALRVTS